MLARADPDRIDDLVDLGSQLREAERSVDARLIRELTTRRRRLVDELTRRAFEVIADGAPSSAVRDEVVSTLTAALADQGVAEQIADGTLVKPARWEGFGFGGAPELSVVPGPTEDSSPARPRKPSQRSEEESPDQPAGQAEPGAKPVARKRLSADQREEQRQRAAAEEAERKAQAKAAADEAKRRALEDARKAADDAEEAVILATDEEQTRVERLRLLEEQVADARRAVDEARIQLRRAEIRQRRTTDALRRLER
jgi:type IV secretory pathway VirB10-like protein